MDQFFYQVTVTVTKSEGLLKAKTLIYVAENDVEMLCSEEECVVVDA